MIQTLTTIIEYLLKIKPLNYLKLNIIKIKYKKDNSCDRLNTIKINIKKKKKIIQILRDQESRYHLIPRIRPRAY